MSDIVDRLRKQSKFMNSQWVMNLFAEAGDHVEHLEHEITRLKTLMNAQCGKVNIVEPAVDATPTDSYDDAMSIVENK